jgi:hypothetical protein
LKISKNKMTLIINQYIYMCTLEPKQKLILVFFCIGSLLLFFGLLGPTIPSMCGCTKTTDEIDHIIPNNHYNLEYLGVGESNISCDDLYSNWTIQWNVTCYQIFHDVKFINQAIYANISYYNAYHMAKYSGLPFPNLFLANVTTECKGTIEQNYECRDSSAKNFGHDEVWCCETNCAYVGGDYFNAIKGGGWLTLTIFGSLILFLVMLAST